MMRPHHVRIRKARGLSAFGLRISGRGLWRVSCDSCPDLEFPTYHRHDQAVDAAAVHLLTPPGWPGILSTDDLLDPATAARIRANVKAYAEALDRARPQIFRAGEARAALSSHSEQEDLR